MIGIYSPEHCFWMPSKSEQSAKGLKYYKSFNRYRQSDKQKPFIPTVALIFPINDGTLTPYEKKLGTYFGNHKSKIKLALIYNASMATM